MARLLERRSVCPLPALAAAVPRWGEGPWPLGQHKICERIGVPVAGLVAAISLPRNKLIAALQGRHAGSGERRTHRASLWGFALWGLLLADGGCARQGVPEQKPFSATTATSVPSVSADAGMNRTETSEGDPARGWELVVAARAGLAFPLPDATGWTAEVVGRWWRAHHAATSSELYARTWTARRSSTPQSCEHQARLWKPDLPGAAQEDVVEERRLDAPPGYATRVTVSIGPGASGSMLVGHVTAFGAAPGECLAVTYDTRAAGPSADMAVGGRLAAFVGAVLPAMQRLTVDDRARDARKQAW
jgi:hypothetical protein